MAKKRCIPCLGADLKKALMAAVLDKGTQMLIREMPECDNAQAVDFCWLPKGQAKGKRGRSEYQEFVSKCMKGKGLKGQPFGAAAPAMKECTIEWRAKKGQSSPASEPAPLAL
jgi:hypothetical protein